jgi:hypothetical protein
MNLNRYQKLPFIKATQALLTELHLPIKEIADEPLSAQDALGEHHKVNDTFALIKEVYIIGMLDDAAFEGREGAKHTELTQSYDGILFFGVQLHQRANHLLPTRSQLADIARAFNRQYQHTPVVVLYHYADANDQYLAFANTERTAYKQTWREGEKAGKVTLLKDVSIAQPHTAHLKILSGLSIEKKSVDSFDSLYRYWRSVFSIQALNDHFYGELQDWFYFASQNIKLPYKPAYVNEKENIKNFLVRLLARTMFCWFVKEKGLIKPELLELQDWDGKKCKLTADIDKPDFLESNSYYRGILQNVFFNALNKRKKEAKKDFKYTKYLNKSFDYAWLTDIPYLNGGIFDKLYEDNAKESIEDTVIKIPNFLFYGKLDTPKNGTKSTGEEVYHHGLNEILHKYKFTLDENTPFEEDIALDPEMLGLVFENLLAELDPNLEESTIKSIRKQTGSYYTPRKVIFEMVNDSIHIYLSKFIEQNYPDIKKAKELAAELIYHDTHNSANTEFATATVHALDKYKVLDPACGSGAFPMGMLHRMVDILKMVDPSNEKWLKLKLKNVDTAQRADFKKVLTSHLDDYSRKLGIIRDSIYGIDIQPLAVQITKLRFFISLLIDQKQHEGITPMPNIETKIICANSLRNIQADLFSTDAIDRLTVARAKYYQPDLKTKEREAIASEIVDVLDLAFPTFAFRATGKQIGGQNKALLLEWFTHGTLAAPFFNMDFFYPELTEQGGFDCVLGNPPYGGVKIDDDVRQALTIDSKDPYGAFIARFLNSRTYASPLKPGGVLAYIVSDTFMTIKSHLKLRQHLMNNVVHKMLRVHPDTFRATVNTAIVIAERNTERELNPNHVCMMADLTNISIHDDYDHFVEILEHTKGLAYTKLGQEISTPEYGIYYYPQSLINSNSSKPFFVASPKLFGLMNDSGPNLTKSIQTIGGKQVQVRKIPMNGKEIEVVKLGDVAEVKHGMTTGDNGTYIYADSSARGTYQEADINKVLTNEEMASLSTKEWNCGFNKKKFSGKFLVPHDKGGESNSSDGWLPNYLVPTKYYIAWDSKSVSEMMNLIGHRHDNPQYYGKEGLTFSPTGVYAPTFRLNSASVFGHKGSNIFLRYYSINDALSILNSKMYRYLLKSYLVHGVDATEKPNSENTIPIIQATAFNTICKKIIKKQKHNPRYDYASNEQIEIDKLVYEAYGLNAEDVEEVENWFARRYTKLFVAQQANLRTLGKSDDYLELYGLK